MEAFEHMIVDEFTEEDFYETIEAPKFVDLTAPDHRPEGDDRYWFCSRVGCDQKHEEFMDSEAIYKKFVLRVMAARSPSVRLRKALYRKDFSVDPKCPNTVPAKPSRSRVSRLAMISSIPHKGSGNLRSKEVKVITTNKNVTPKAKVSSVPQKALTERKKQIQSPAAFRSVQNPRNANIKVSENRVVAKALVFQSPKKLVKLKRSVELSSSVKKLCNGMRKLEIENKRNGLGVNHKVVSSVPSRRPLKTREVKSRVFDSVRSQKQNDTKTIGVSTLKKKVKKKEEPVLSSDPSKAHEANGMEFVIQSLTRTDKANAKEELILENKSEELSDTLKAHMNNQLQDREDPAVIKESGVATSKQYQIAEIEEKENALALECDDKENATIASDVDRDDTSVIKESGLDKAKQFENAKNEDKANVLALECEDKENAPNAADVDREGDDKENSSALDNNRKVNQATYPLLKKKVFAKKEICKTTRKVMTAADKCFNGKTVSAGSRMQYTKPKLTNPKPFRLRTDERRILKEANTEKKPQCTLAKEETASIIGFHGENFGPKHQPVRLEKNTTSRLKASRGTSTTLVSENMMNCKRVALSRKKQVASKGIETVEETKTMNGESKEVATINKPSVCVVASGEKRPATVPKGPNFHSIHVPKSCTKRVASLV